MPRELLFREDGQEYAVVEKSLGDCRFVLRCADGVCREGKIRGTMRRRKSHTNKRKKQNDTTLTRTIFAKVKSCVLIGLRGELEGRKAKADIIHIYSSDEMRNLESYGEVPSGFTDRDVLRRGEAAQQDYGFDFENI